MFTFQCINIKLDVSKKLTDPKKFVYEIRESRVAKLYLFRFPLQAIRGAPSAAVARAFAFRALHRGSAPRAGSRYVSSRIHAAVERHEKPVRNDCGSRAKKTASIVLLGERTQTTLRCSERKFIHYRVQGIDIQVRTNSVYISVAIL